MTPGRHSLQVRACLTASWLKPTSAALEAELEKRAASRRSREGLFAGVVAVACQRLQNQSAISLANTMEPHPRYCLLDCEDAEKWRGHEAVGG